LGYPIWNGLRLGLGYPISTKRSELTNQQKLLVPCPIFAAAIGEHCQMYLGFGRRNEPHAERKYQAIQAMEQNCVTSDSAFIASGNRATT
jgi:hypothetical protein